MSKDLKDSVSEFRSLVGELKKLFVTSEKMNRDAVVFSNIWSSASKNITNIETTLRETRNLGTKIARGEDLIFQKKLKLRKISNDIKSLAEENKSLTGKDREAYHALGKELLNKERLLKRNISKLQISNDQYRDSVLLNREIDTLKQKYIKNQNLITLTEWRNLRPIERRLAFAKLALDFLEDTFRTYNKIDTSVTSIRKTFGNLVTDTNDFYSYVTKTTVKLTHLGVTAENIAASMKSIGSSTGGLLVMNSDIVDSVSMMSKSFDIIDSTSTKFLKSMGEISNSSSSSNVSMLGFVKSMSNATNIPLDELMNDVAELSDDTRLFLKYSTIELIKSATAARRLGTTLSKISATAQKLLNFESSIQSELKVSALIGKNISFNEARRLFFQGKLIEGNNEILKLAKQVNLNQLNPIQMQAFAEASGKSVGELQSMLQREKDIEWIRANGNKQDLARLASYERLTKLSDQQSKFEGERARKEMLRINNQTKMENIQSKFNVLMIELQEPLLDLTDMLLNITIKILPTMLRIAQGVFNMFQAWTFVKFVGKGLKTIFTNMKAIFGQVKNLGKTLVPFIKSFVQVGKLGAIFMKVVNPIGWIITGLQIASNIMKDWGKFGDDFVGGLKVIASGIVKAFLPFQVVYDWIDEHFMGHSPSKIGIGIVKGLKSVGSMILQAIIQPFINGYNWIQDSFIGKLLPGGSIENPKLFGSIDTTSQQTTKNQQLEDIKSSNELVAKKIDELISLMSSGGIAINLDGTKLNSALATSTNRRGLRGEPTTL